MNLHRTGGAGATNLARAGAAGTRARSGRKRRSSAGDHNKIYNNSITNTNTIIYEIRTIPIQSELQNSEFRTLLRTLTGARSLLLAPLRLGLLQEPLLHIKRQKVFRTLIGHQGQGGSLG